MKKALFFAAWFLLAFHAVSQTWSWAQGSDGSSGAQLGKNACDKYGNLYITGTYAGTISFGSQTLTGSANNIMYLTKYDPLGNLIWAVTNSGTGNCFGNAVSVDSSGNAYVCGVFSTSVSIGVNTITSNGTTDVFLAKYDPAGNLLWLRGGGGSTNDAGYGVCNDLTGNVFICGMISSALASFGTATLAGNGLAYSFLGKYDANGNVLWVKKAGISTMAHFAERICSGISGQINIAGQFQYNIVFGTDSLNGEGFLDAYVAAFDSMGNYQWSHAGSGNALERIHGIATDLKENVYVAGGFTGSMSIAGQSFSSAVSGDGFMARFSKNGTPVWAKSASGSGNTIMSSVCTYSGGVFVAGGSQGAFSFSGLSWNNIGNSNGTFVMQLDTSGNPLQSVILNETGSEARIAALSQCTVYLSGLYSANSFTVGNTVLTKNANYAQIFNAKLTLIPNVAITGATFLTCAGQSVTLGGTGGYTYTWNTGATTQSIIVSPTVNTTYTLNSTDNCGSSSAMKTITVNPLPLISAVTNKDTICSGDQVVLTASGANTYTWTSGILNGAPFSPSVSANYTVAGSSTEGCLSNTISLYVQVFITPTVAPSASSTLICSGKSATLYASGATSYSWDPGGLSHGTVIVTPALNTVYTVTKTNAKCMVTDFIYIEVMPSPVLFTTISATRICTGNTVTLAASGADLYYWSTSDSGNVITVKPAVTSSYTVTGTSLLNSCSTSHVFNVEVVDCTVGLSETKLKGEVRIFPNPAKSLITLQLPDSLFDCQITLYCPAGKKITGLVCNSGMATLDLSGLEPGLYLVEISKGGQSSYHTRLVIE